MLRCDIGNIEMKDRTQIKDGYVLITLNLFAVALEFLVVIGLLSSGCG